MGRVMRRMSSSGAFTLALRSRGGKAIAPYEMGSSAGAVGSGRLPGFHQLTELRLASRRGIASATRRPRPADERILGQMVDQRGHVAIAVAGAILDLLADLTQ